MKACLPIIVIIYLCVKQMFNLELYLLGILKSECSSVYTQLISRIEEGGLETEGLLRIPGAAGRIKVISWFYSCHP